MQSFYFVSFVFFQHILCMPFYQQFFNNFMTTPDYYLVKKCINIWDPACRSYRSLSSRSITKDKNRLWQNRIVPYILSDNFHNNEIKLIRNSMDKIENYSCIRFVEITEPTGDYVQLVRTGGCSSDIGRKGGKQLISLHPECFDYNGSMILHELLHTLGLFHEHNRPDRDNYIKIFPKNIIKGKLRDFNKKNAYAVEFEEFNYDFESILHYPPEAYSIDKDKPVYIPLNKSIDAKLIGTSSDLSAIDKAKINKLYNCELTECPLPAPLANGQIISNNNYKIGSSITYSCDDNYILIGSNYSNCLTNGKWSGIRPLCVSQVLHYCNFEDPFQFCNWIQSSIYIWRINDINRPYLNIDTCPKVDLTFGSTNGHFLFTNSLNRGCFFKIETPIIFGIGSVCITFGYYKYGNGEGELKVSLIKTRGDKIELLKISKNLEPQWISYLSIIYFEVYQSFKIEFQAKIKRDKRLISVAIDEVMVYVC